MLRCITSPTARFHVDPKRLSELAPTIQEPKLRFRRSNFISLCALSLVKETRALVDSKTEGNAPPDEQTYSMHISGYSNLVKRGPPNECKDTERCLAAVCEDVDEIW